MAIADASERGKIHHRVWTWLNESLEGTGSFYRRKQEDRERDDGSTFRASGNGINFPTAIFLFLLAQLVGGVWWGATMQSDVNHEIADRARQEGQLWQEVATYKLEVDQLRLEVARLQSVERKP